MTPPPNPIPLQVRTNVPSWCDRILWKSYPETHVNCNAYGEGKPWSQRGTPCPAPGGGNGDGHPHRGWVGDKGWVGDREQVGDGFGVGWGQVWGTLAMGWDR